jgi:CheY-like chemotaxis protein
VRTPSVVITCRGKGAFRDEAVAARFDAYDTEPFDLEKLIETVASLIRAQRRLVGTAPEGRTV